MEQYLLLLLVCASNLYFIHRIKQLKNMIVEKDRQIKKEKDQASYYIRLSEMVYSATDKLFYQMDKPLLQKKAWKKIFKELVTTYTENNNKLQKQMDNQIVWGDEYDKPLEINWIKSMMNIYSGGLDASNT